jgi:hypothetical protein
MDAYRSPVVALIIVRYLTARNRYRLRLKK